MNKGLFLISSIYCLLSAATSPFASADEYRLQAVLYNQPGLEPSTVIINGQKYKEGEQIGKYGVEKIEEGRVLMRDKLTEQSLSLRPESTDPKSPPPEVFNSLPKSSDLPARTLEEMPKGLKDLMREAESIVLTNPREGRYYPKEISTDALLTLGAFVGLNSLSEAQDKEQLNQAIESWLRGVTPQSPQWNEFKVRLIAFLRERTQNCQIWMKSEEGKPPLEECS